MTITTYTVKWEIEIDAESPRAAAEDAWEIMRDPSSYPPIFEVIPHSDDAIRMHGETQLIDLADAPNEDDE